MAQAIKQPINPYNRLYKRELANDELSEIQHNLVGFFDVLIQLDQISKQKEKSNDQSNKRSPNHSD